MSAYRPNPIEFPERLADAAPTDDRVAARATTGITVLATGLMGSLVSAAYLRLALQTMIDVWKPGVGLGISLLIVWLGAWSIRTQPTFIRRGEWLAIYEKGLKTKVISTQELVLVQLNKLQTVRLSFASIVVTLIGLIGLPAYVFTSQSPEFMPAAWLTAALVLGLTLAYEVVAGRFGSTTIRVGASEYVVPKRLLASSS